MFVSHYSILITCGSTPHTPALSSGSGWLRVIHNELRQLRLRCEVLWWWWVPCVQCGAAWPVSSPPNSRSRSVRVERCHAPSPVCPHSSPQWPVSVRAPPPSLDLSGLPPPSALTLGAGARAGAGLNWPLCPLRWTQIRGPTQRTDRQYKTKISDIRRLWISKVIGLNPLTPVVTKKTKWKWNLDWHTEIYYTGFDVNFFLF